MSLRGNFPIRAADRMHSNDLLQQCNIQVGLTVENKSRSHSNDVLESVSPNFDSLSTKLKLNVLKE